MLLERLYNAVIGGSGFAAATLSDTLNTGNTPTAEQLGEVIKIIIQIVIAIFTIYGILKPKTKKK